MKRRDVIRAGSAFCLAAPMALARMLDMQCARVSDLSLPPTGLGPKPGVPSRYGFAFEEVSKQAQNDRRLHFGLGKAPHIEKIEVRWPSGVNHTYPALTANQIHVLEES